MVTEQEKEIIRLLAGTLNALGMDNDTIIIIIEAMYHRIELMYKLMNYISDHPTITADEAETEAERLIQTTHK
jgi:hypothetical protein